MNLIVRRKPGFERHRGLISTPLGETDCSLGKAGITTRKREGDGATPSGTHEVLYGYVRDDRWPRQRSELSLEPIHPNDGWSDDPAFPAYNRPVRLPFPGTHEKLMREDRLYDICLVLDYNISSTVRGRGSAIFFHLANEQMGATEGCIALEPDAMRRLLGIIRSGTKVTILPG